MGCSDGKCTRFNFGLYGAIKPIQNISYDFKKTYASWLEMIFLGTKRNLYVHKNVFAWIQEGKALENKTQILS